MIQRYIILFMLYLSWPISLSPRLFKSNQPVPVLYQPYPLATQQVSLQWYVYLLAQSLSWLMVIGAATWWINSRYRYDKIIGGTLSLLTGISIIELIHYIIAYNTFAPLHVFECLLIVSFAIKNFIQSMHHE